MPTRFVVIPMIVVCCLALGALGTVAEDGGFTFSSEGMRLTAYFGDENVRIVLSDGRVFELPQVISASGARYSDGSILFWNKGDDALFEFEGLTHNLTVIDPSVDPWTKAAQVGVTFRGVGTEPGWFVEIRDGESIHLSLDYGDTEIKTPIGAMEIDYAMGTRTYRTNHLTSPIDILVTIRNTPCYDSMSGEGFAAQVLIEFQQNYRLYRGCGRYL